LVNRLRTTPTVTRNDIQEVCKEIGTLECDVVLEFATRCGKSRSALNIVKDEPTLLICPTHLICDDWRRQIKESGSPFQGDIICYQSLKKYIGNKYKNVIYDEGHHISDDQVESLEQMVPDRYIVLSATLPYQKKILWRKLLTTPFEWKIPLQQAIDWGILPPPKIICVGLRLKTDKRHHPFYNSRNKAPKDQIVPYDKRIPAIYNKTVNTIIQCTEAEYHELCVEKYLYWKGLEDTIKEESEAIEEALKHRAVDPNHPIPERTVKMPLDLVTRSKFRSGLERKKFFSKLKNRYIRRTIEYFGLDRKRMMIFCEDTPQADFIDKRFAIHSKNKDSKLFLEEFNEGIRDKLISVNMLQEGVEVLKVDAALIVQISGSNTKGIQQSGRTLLSEFPEIYLLYYRDTQDESYMKNFVKKFKKEYVHYVDPYRETS
jgi:superfamily II DNA or RNA helicase